MARQPLQIQTEVRNQKPNILLLHAQIFWISSQTRQRQWEKSVIFLQEILLLRIEKSFYISHWKSVAVPFLGSTRTEVESAVEAILEDARQVPTRTPPIKGPS